ncbi:STAS domain-containing protein [Micromonospora sp. PLK6-60]|uniref:STAS domain-containing protein n=1 Tax=Micromonospora sp. PLK6-60 TaxID=2873383 RepID=UPI001CA63851|nr:STAS domain-containing protein [Micromonospora sp. PLK6-60]MBY8870577.1 STAS domain-containing protein [Micromonospora sp. PLK6-60]
MTPSSEPDWQLEVTALTRCPGVRLRGEVDLSTVPTLELALDLLVETAGDVTVDLHKLTFIDVLGSRALAQAAIRLCATGRRMRLRGANPQLRRMLSVLGWAELFDFPLAEG